MRKGDMEREGHNLIKERRHGEGLIDRSKVRILLCDNEAKSSEEVISLLLKCSYEVTSVKSARQVIDALNAEGPDIDIILAEVDLPMKKGMKMLKYITRDEELRRIPVIMMSAKDEVSVVVKCLSLGAADYLVKPLRTNELLNLWTHMWRRRRMLGLAEKNILSYDFDLVMSDPSDANTNSTTLFSDDTDDKSQRSTNPEMGVANCQKDELIVGVGVAVSVAPAIVELSTGEPLEYCSNMEEMSNCRTGQLLSGPKKSLLKIGESSAFFTYVKSSTTKNNSQGIAHIGIATQTLRMEGKPQLCDQQRTGDGRVYANGNAWKAYSQGDDFRSSSSIPNSVSLEKSCTLPLSQEFHNFKEENFHQVHRHQRNELQLEVSGSSTQSMYPCYMSGIVNQVAVPSSGQLCQKNLHELPSHATLGMLPQYNHLQQCPPHMAGMTSIPYCPPSLCLQPGQISANQSWQSFGSSASPDVNLNKVDRREAALMKFRQKRKERCFHKKIRYVNRKKLAERRPRVRGQFVRKVNGVSVDLNGQPATADYDEHEEEDEDELTSRDSSPEDDASGS